MASVPLTKLPDLTVGDRFDWAVQFTDPNQNFASIAVASVLRLATPPYTNPAFTFVPTISFPLAGNNTTFTAVLSMTGTQTDALGVGLYTGDIVLSMAGYGPYSAIAFSLNVMSQITAH